MMIRPIFNLEFPSWCPEINIYGYKFIRVNNYSEELQKLQHTINFQSEFIIIANTGQHAITARVEISRKEDKSVMQWSGSNNTALMDILLLLSLFTGRDVFAGSPITGENKQRNIEVINRDSRMYQFGGSLRTSIPYKGKTIEENIQFNIGFEEELNRIYTLMRSNDWKKEYGNGYFLLLARQAFHTQTVEATFVQCWTIWEHLFTIHNQNWISDVQIRKLASEEKIAYILIKYAFQENMNEISRKRIIELSKIRNRLIHFGRLPEGEQVFNDAILFIRLTEFILSKTIGLLPSNIFNTIEKLEEFLNRKN